MLAQFENMSEGHLRLINAVPHQIQLTASKDFPMPWDPYWACLEVGKFRKQKIKMMLVKDAIEAPQTKWASRIVFRAREYDRLQVHIDYGNRK